MTLGVIAVLLVYDAEFQRLCFPLFSSSFIFKEVIASLSWAKYHSPIVFSGNIRQNGFWQFCAHQRQHEGLRS